MRHTLFRLGAALSFIFLFSSCEEKLDLSQITAGPDGKISWQDAVKVLTYGDVNSVMQTHSGLVRIRMKGDGPTYETQSPQIDEVIRVIERAGKKDKIGIMLQ